MDTASLFKMVNRSLNHLTDSLTGRIQNKLSKEEPAADALRVSGMTLPEILASINSGPDASFYIYSIKLATPRKIALSGDGSWSVTFDGSGNVTAPFSLAPSGITAGQYCKLTVDSKGRAVEGDVLTPDDIPSLPADKINSGTLSMARFPFIPLQQGGGTNQSLTKLFIGYNVTNKDLRLQIDTTDHGSNWPINITGKAATATTADTATRATSADTATRAVSADTAIRATSADTATNASNAANATNAQTAGSATKWSTPRTVAFTGDVTASFTLDGTANVSQALALSNTGVTAGTYGSVRVDAKGRVTEGAIATPIANGGTGATTVEQARINLGIGNMNARNIFISTAAPTAADGANGDLWLQYI